jgi:hypothetical protein
MLVHALLYAAIAAVWIVVLGGAVVLSERKKPRPHEDGDGAGGKQGDDGLPMAA